MKYFILIKDGKVTGSQLAEECPEGGISAPEGWTPETSILELVDGELVEKSIKDENLSRAKVQAISLLKSNTKNKIEEKYPQHKQLNTDRKALEAHKNTVANGKTSKEDEVAFNAQQEMSAFIDSCRDESKKIQAKIEKAKNIQDIEKIIG